VSASINDRCPSFQWCPHYSNRQDDIAQLERENAALRDARSVAEQVCAEAFAKVFADYAAKTLTKDTQP
jgi:hypothetical protein